MSETHQHQCYYCLKSSNCFGDIVRHTVCIHSEQKLKIKRVALCSLTGYLTKNFDIEKGEVSKPWEPARNPSGVREFYRAQESKILPHVPRGLNLANE
jgi:hypothetical protein